MNQTHRAAPRYVVELAREFRKEPTLPEGFLWECLRDRRMCGFKFRRQHPAGRYIADFFCSDVGLVVELDGAVHDGDDRVVYDRVRDEEMALKGLRVLRIRNEGLLTDPEGVVELIAETLASLPRKEKG